MDELKSKLFDFIHQHQSNNKIPIVGDSSSSFPQQEEKKETPAIVEVEQPERPSDQEIRESVDPKYYEDEKEFDAGRYELEKYSMMDIDKIELDLKILGQQQNVVSNHVLQMILEKQSVCQKEFNRIIEVQSQVDGILNCIKSGRVKLGIATKHFTTASLGILANYRKRTLVQQLVRYLNTIKTLHKTESKVPELLDAGDFSGAIDLLLECQSVASTYRHFSCVAALSSKLQDTLVMTEEKLDVALSKICDGFNGNVYEKLQAAYYLLGKTEIAMDQLHMHFTSAVNNTASRVVCSYVELSSHNCSELQYAQICKKIQEQHFIPCLLSLCKSLWCIVLSYNQVVNWHQRNPRTTDDANFEMTLMEQKIKQKLNSGLTRLWHDVQTKVSLLVLAANLSAYKIDDFLQVLGILHRLSQIGEELCESESEEVANSIRTQSINYFNSYHSAKLDDLKVFLENESWTPCPVRSDFSLLHLQEFRGLRCSVEQCAGVNSRHNTSVDSSSAGANFFNRFPDPNIDTPFDSSFQVDSKDEDILANIPEDPSGYFSEESEEDGELSSVAAEICKGRKSSNLSDNGPLLTNTTLTVLRLCGKYLQMSRLLKSIVTEVIMALTQLFEYYLYTIYSFFSSDLPDGLCGSITSLKLQSVMNRIKNSLFENVENSENESKIVEAQLSPIVDLSSPATMFGLMERIVAVESLTFLAQEYTFLKSYLEKLIQNQDSSKHYLNQFFNQTVSSATEIRKPVYACVSWRVIDVKQILTMMSKVDWEVKDVVTEHSKYVDFLMPEIKNFHNCLEEINTNIQIPEQAINVIWDCLIYLICNIFVEGFSSSKKCTSGGRALMQLDFIQTIGKLERLCPIRPIPHSEFVESYIKAYYQREEDLEIWIKEHKEYSSKQLSALVSCACQSNKKSRQKLTQLIEDMEKSGAR